MNSTFFKPADDVFDTTQRQAPVSTDGEMFRQNGHLLIERVHDHIKIAKKLFELADNHKELEVISHKLNIVILRYVPEDFYGMFDTEEYLNELNEEIVNRIPGGETLLSGAAIKGKFGIRACVVNSNTNGNEIKALIEVVAHTGKKVHKELSNKYWGHSSYGILPE